jgi:uncharacterized protein
MNENKVFFGQGNILLEGLYANPSGAMGAVISHPHPLMGGDMTNTIVEIMTETLFANGMSTLRFNFRGVGKSTGTFDNGRGEQDDVLAAVSFIEGQGIREILPAAYSFGVWVTADVLQRRNFLPALFVSPPIDFFNFDIQALRGKVGLIICGDKDQYCPAEKIRGVAAELGCGLDIISDADHFFQLRENEVVTSVNNFAMQLKA